MRGGSPIFWVGVCHPSIKALTPFQKIIPTYWPVTWSFIIVKPAIVNRDPGRSGRQKGRGGGGYYIPTFSKTNILYRISDHTATIDDLSADQATCIQL